MIVLVITNITINHHQEVLLKFSGMKKPVYNSSKQMVKQILGIIEEIQFKDVCVQLGCPEIISEAENLLILYSHLIF